MYKIETLDGLVSEIIFCSCMVKIIRSTPPATPVAPISSLLNALVNVSYLPPPAKAPSLNFCQILQKQFQSNNLIL